MTPSAPPPVSPTEPLRLTREKAVEAWRATEGRLS